MADRWMDERDRRYRERDWRRSEDYGSGRRYSGGEGRSFGDDHPEDRVFGQRESGTSYDGRTDHMRPGGGAYGAGGAYGSGEGYRSGYGERVRSDWQDADYGGVSPAMQQGEYDAERYAERYDREHPIERERRMGGGRGGRYYGDSGRERIYRQEYGQGGVEYGDVPRGYDAGYRGYGPQRGGSGGYSGGTGGYDYERGYGDGGRYGRSYSGDRGWGSRDQDTERTRRFEQAGHDAGDFFRRAGERVASWFGGEGERRDERDFRGIGPKGYKRADERISDEVHERLTDDPWIDASNISCSVSGGEVTLSGTVENREAKHRAERCVEDVSGVSHVQNNLRVDRGSFFTSAAPGYGDSVLEAQMRGETGSGADISSGAPGRASSAASRTSGADAGKSR